MSEETRVPAVPLRGAVCPRCLEKPAASGSVHWLIRLPAVVVGDLPGSLDYCHDCAGGLNLLYALIWTGSLAVGFVVAVVLWSV
jgi:hypothetical protein